MGCRKRPDRKKAGNPAKEKKDKLARCEQARHKDGGQALQTSGEPHYEQAASERESAQIGMIKNGGGVEGRNLGYSLSCGF
jgi:hypothetical protein